MSNKAELYLKFPRYGLCNKIITWAKAFVWCKENDADLFVKSWVHVPIGSVLRREKAKRWYRNFFITPSMPFLKKIKFFKAPIIHSIDDDKIKGNQYYKFESTPLITDIPLLANYRNEIITSFFEMIEEKHLKTLEQIKSPIIGVHIRRGDFITNGSVLDLTYYIDVINDLRKINGNNLEVVIFSDGHENELLSILELPNVSLFKTVNDLIDLIVLSRSEILVTTKGSSYSYWAGFISDAAVIHHPETWVKECRPEKINTLKYEGVYPEANCWPDLLIKNIKVIS
ncbi:MULTISPECIES: alpha-1,2-fucosyltransferase [Winogradskyella]|uniref:alpha-1,2-fucosyltransferase n=1 Tax=Winogradskyella TaxID=286104 RepID=UPI0015CA0FA3|nr:MULTISPECIES: alpha-1,2-fucosyltransferase [Winogradskyella]QXP80019.1 alpha-1,2-fucosyltransferase [Winogradskyella sp. HaHa_3_26]